MRLLEGHRAMSVCNGNGVFIYPIPITKSGLPKLKIEINNAGDKKQGTEEYLQSKKKVNTKLYDKIWELYIMIYNKNKDRWSI